jgi:hypothetical protein
MPTTPHDLELSELSITAMVDLWQSARSRVFLAEYEPTAQLCTDDCWTELAVATRLANEITAGRWCVVRRLLCRGVVTSWTQVGQAVGMTGTQARTGFIDWITGQISLRRRSGTIGLTDTEADDLRALAASVGP